VVDHAGRLGVLIVEYRDPSGAAAIIRDLRGFPDAEIVVISTGPEPFPAAGGARVIHLPSNPGFGAALNRGVRLLSPEVLHFLISNTDVRCSAAGVRRRWEEAKRSGLAMVAPTIVGRDGKVEWDGGRIDFTRFSVIHEHMGEDPRTGGVVEPTMFMMGAQVLIARSAWEGVGGMREDFFLYGEDADFSMRVRRAGLGAAVDTGVRAVHEPSSSVGRYSPLQVYLMTRNNIRFFREWSPKLWGRLLCWLLVPVRLAFVFYRKGTALRDLLRWIAWGTWDARSASPRHAYQGRAAQLLSRAGEGR